MKSGAGLWLLALTLLLVACGDSMTTPPDSGPPASLSFAESTVVFPDTIIDRVVATSTRAIEVTNVGGQPVTPAFTLTDEADFVIESTPCDALAPGATCHVVVRFEPHTLGARSVELVATSAESSITTTLVGVSLPEPGLSWIPMLPLDYGEVAVGATKTLRATVRNTSTVTARPFAVALAGVDVDDFSLFFDTCSGMSIDPDGRCLIEVSFTPSAASPRDAYIVLSSGNLGSVEIGLHGNGYLPAHLAVSPGTGMFGSVFELAQSSVQAFTVTNTGTVPTSEVQVAISGTHASSFTMSDGCSGAPLAGGASCMFSIVYRPGVVGMHQATATVSAKGVNSLAVPLTGTGEPPHLEITPSLWMFDNVMLGQSTPAKTFAVKNTGTTNTGPLAPWSYVANMAVAFSNDGCTGTDLAPDATCTVDVVATPAARGVATAILRISAPRGDRARADVGLEVLVPAIFTPFPTAPFAFGDVQITESPAQQIEIVNTGNFASGPITVAVVGADRNDVSLIENCSGTSLPQYGSCHLTVSFSPSHVGAVVAAVELTSSDASLSLPVTANGLPAPQFTVSPNATVVNPAIVGEPYPLTFVAQGTGSATGPLTVTVIGAHAADYAVTGGDCSGQTLAASQACTVTLTLTPAASGARDATLVVSGMPGGYRRIPLKAIAFKQATLSVSRLTVDFAATGIGQINTYGFLTFTNTGERSTGVLTAQLTGAQPTEFGVIADTCTGVVLVPGAQCSVHTQFAPTQVATSTAALVVSASPGGTISTTLSGTGLPPPVITSPITAYDFPARETFTVGYAQIRIDNIGGSPTDHLRSRLTGPHANAFRTNDYACFRVNAGAWCTLYVEFHPTEVGQATATLLVESQVAGTVTISLTGAAAAGTKISVSPAVHDFGLVAIGGDSAIQTFTATNLGQRDVTMFNAFVPSNFQIVSTTCGPTLAPNASCQSDVVFRPITSNQSPSRFVFLEDTLLKGEAELRGQTPL